MYIALSVHVLWDGSYCPSFMWSTVFSFRGGDLSFAKCRHCRSWGGDPPIIQLAIYIYDLVVIEHVSLCYDIHTCKVWSKSYVSFLRYVSLHVAVFSHTCLLFVCVCARCVCVCSFLRHMWISHVCCNIMHSRLKLESTPRVIPRVEWGLLPLEDWNDLVYYILSFII